jgi:hypothetical protein
MLMRESIHFVTVSAPQTLVENLWERIATMGGFRFSHIVHPILDRRSWDRGPPPPNAYFFCDDANPRMPSPDRDLLSSLEREEVPTVHNMILSDRTVALLDYGEALAYSTFLTRRLMILYETLRPNAVIGAFDALHGSLGFAVASSVRRSFFGAKRLLGSTRDKVNSGSILRAGMQLPSPIIFLCASL